MVATDIDVFTPLRLWLIKYTGLTEIMLGYDGGERPAKPYGMLNLIRLNNDAPPVDKVYVVTSVPDGYSGNDEDITQEPLTTWEWVWSFNVYGSNCMTTIQKLNAAWQVPNAHQEFEPYHIADHSEIRHLPELINEEYEDRAQIDLMIHAQVQDGALIGVIEKAPLETGSL